jgi:hypothetical protein
MFPVLGVWGLRNQLGVPPCWRAYFLLLRQKKVAKEKATPRSAPATPVPCATRHWRGLRNSGFALRQSSPFFRQHLRCSAPLMGTPKSVSQGTDSPKIKANGDLWVTQKHSEFPSSTDGLPGPMRGAEQRRNVGGLRRGLSEGEARVPQPPGVSSSARDRAKPGADPGSPFLCLLSFGEAKESKTPRKGGTPCQLVDHHAEYRGHD